MASVVLTTVFVVTGLHSLWRLASGRGGTETVVDVNQIVMSPAMLMMVWWPHSTVGSWVLVALFAAAALFFFHRLSGLVGTTARATALLHAGMNLGMVWMLLAMPTAMSSTPQSWTALLSWTVVGLLALAAVWWLVHVLRSAGHRLACGCHALATAGMAGMLALMLPAL